MFVSCELSRAVPIWIEYFSDYGVIFYIPLHFEFAAVHVRMENLVPFDFEYDDRGVESQVIQDQMWSLYQQTYPFEDDWASTNSPLTQVVDENINENYFAIEDEKDDYQTDYIVPLIDDTSVDEHSDRCGVFVEDTTPKKCCVATMRIVKPPLGWKFPTVTCIKAEKHLSKINCCVVNCNNSPQRCSAGVKFHSFPGKPYEKERKEMWISAINRVNPDGSSWQPTKHSKVCSDHFVGGVVSNIASHPSYVPSIFPPANEDSAISSRKSTDKKEPLIQ